MLQKSSEMSDELPIVSIVIIADKTKCPPGYLPVSFLYRNY